MKKTIARILPSAFAALLCLAAPLVAQEKTPPPPAPAAAEPAPEEGGLPLGLLYNPAERAEKGRQALGASAPEAAAEALDTALRLDPQNEPARYNAGTAHLLAASEKAAPLLEAAARSEDKTLAAKAYYNLGNARLAAEDLPAAVEAYKNSLRRDPTSADAKFNLELALRRLQEQQKQNQQNQKSQNQDQQQQQEQQEQQQKQQGQGQDQQQQEQQQQEGQEKKDGQEQEQQQQNGQEKEGQGQEEQKQQQQGKPGQQGQKESPLPQFRDLKDMDAQQAAAILEAIENLERSQRRQDAKKAQKANVRGKKDW